MKITSTRVNELGEMEYTVVPTVEERNWMAVYENMRRNMLDYEMNSLDEFAEEACNYCYNKCSALNRMLYALRSKLGKMLDSDLEPLYIAVVTYDETECLRAYRHMRYTFNNDQVEALNRVLDGTLKYDSEKRGLMLDAMEQAAELIDRGALFLKVKEY